MPAILLHIIQSYLPQAHLESFNDNEIVYHLPSGDNQMTQYGALFQKLDALRYNKQHNIICYGVSDSTLEDV